ncbi:MAG: 1,6-anhydro-N-acetylmuramyl-L-alanine amidase AmpD [Colwellia sp.]
MPDQKVFSINDGWLTEVTQHPSPFFTPRLPTDSIELLVVHNISLPAGQFNTPYIDDLFLGNLDCNADKSFCDLKGVEVSAHCLIKRDGTITQYVSFNDKAWHAGISTFKGKDKCNDFSIGIELEGCDDIHYEEIQYQQLAKIAATIQCHHPLVIDSHIKGHCDIAPGRKTDPGEAFDWQKFHQYLLAYK